MKISHLKHVHRPGARSKVLPDVNRAEVARKLGMSRSNVSKILSGTARPTADTLLALAKIFYISPDELDTKLKQIAEKHR